MFVMRMYTYQNFVFVIYLKIQREKWVKVNYSRKNIHTEFATNNEIKKKKKEN